MRRSTRLLALLGATLMVASVTAGAPSTASRRSEVYAVSGPSTITLTGHGYGHGHGMSQHGAEGAARQGRRGSRSSSSTTRAPHGGSCGDRSRCG